jgi:hypothetical protein
MEVLLNLKNTFKEGFYVEEKIKKLRIRSGLGKKADLDSD